MVLICAAIRGHSLSYLRFLFLSLVQILSHQISLVCLLKSPYSCFSSHFCFPVIFVLLMFVLSVLLVVTLIYLSMLFFFHFLWSIQVWMDASMRPSTLWWVLVFLLFLIYTICLRHLWDVRPYESSWFYLFSGPFFKVLPWTTSRMVPSILPGAAQAFIPLMKFLL